MSKAEDLPEATKKVFYAIIDEVVLNSDQDKDMKEGLQTLDRIARKMKISFYDLMLQIFEYEEIVRKVTEWKKEKNIKDDTPE